MAGSSPRREPSRRGAWLKAAGLGIGLALAVAGAVAIAWSHAASSIPLVVRVSGPDGEILTKGTLTIDFGLERKGPIPITDRGEAYLPVVPKSFVGKEVRIHLNSPGYALTGSASRKLDASSVLALTAKKLAQPPRKVAGLVKDQNGMKVAGARMSLPKLDLHGASNQDGHFEFAIDDVELLETMLRVEKDGFQTREQYVSVGNEDVTVNLER